MTTQIMGWKEARSRKLRPLKSVLSVLFNIFLLMIFLSVFAYLSGI